MKFLNPIILFVGELNLGKDFFAVISLCLLLASVLLLALSIFFKRLRRLNKTAITSTVILIYLLCSVKTLCQFYATKSIDLLQLIICFTLAFFETATLTAFNLLPLQKNLLPQDNGVIDEYFKKTKPSSLQEDCIAFSKNPFRRIERLKTAKMFERDEKTDFNVNYSYILKRIDSLYSVDLSSDEKTDLTNLKLLIERISRKDLTENERATLCDGIRKFLKISAKYDGFLQAKF